MPSGSDESDLGFGRDLHVFVQSGSEYEIDSESITGSDEDSDNDDDGGSDDDGGEEEGREPGAEPRQLIEMVEQEPPPPPPASATLTVPLQRLPVRTQQALLTD